MPSTEAIYQELITLLPAEDELPRPEALTQGMEELCARYGTARMQAVLDELAVSDDITHRGMAAAFRVRLDRITKQRRIPN
jgi:hypothetical protein